MGFSVTVGVLDQHAGSCDVKYRGLEHRTSSPMHLDGRGGRPAYDLNGR